MSSVTATRMFIAGKVQGVGYRAWLAREAERRGLRGWVRNRHGGSVEALVIASSGELADFISLCRIGPSAARVTEITVQDESVAAGDVAAAFAIRPTL